MNDYLNFAISYAFLYQSTLIDTEASDWYERAFISIKEKIDFKELQAMFERLPVDTRLYRLVRREIIAKATGPTELVSVITLTSRNSVEEISLVKQVIDLAKEGDEADQEEIKEIVRERIKFLSGDPKGRMQRLFKELLK